MKLKNYAVLIFCILSPSIVFASFKLGKSEIIETEDHVHLRVVHFSNPGKPILIAFPGLGAKDRSFEKPIERLKEKFDIYIGNWRGSSFIEQPHRMYGEHNGLHEVARLDFPAVLRHALKNATPEQRAYGVTLLGHSMGGIMIMGGLTDPSLFNEFKPDLRAILLFQSPHHLKYLKTPFKLLGQLAKPVLGFLKNRQMIAVNTHSRLWDFTKEKKLNGNFIERKVTALFENAVIAISSFAFKADRLDHKTFRRVALTMSAWSIPIELLDDFGHAIRTQGILWDRTGTKPLIDPAMVRDIKVAVLMATEDSLAPSLQQQEYYDSLSTTEKQLVVLHGWGHLKSVFHNGAGEDFFHLIEEFIEAPREKPLLERIEFRPNCERQLKK